MISIIFRIKKIIKFLQNTSSVLLNYLKNNINGDSCLFFCSVLYLSYNFLKSNFALILYKKIIQFLFIMSAYILDYCLNSLDYETLNIQLVIIFIVLLITISFLKNILKLLETNSIWKIWICIAALIFSFVLILYLIGFEVYYPNFKLVILILKIIISFYFLFIEMLIIPKIRKILKKNVIEAFNIIPMLNALKPKNKHFLVLSHSLDLVPAKIYLKNQYFLSGFYGFKNRKVSYFKNFSVSITEFVSLEYFYSNSNQKQNFLKFLKILKDLYSNKSKNLLNFQRFITFLNDKGYKDSGDLFSVMVFIIEPKNLYIIPQIIKDFEISEIISMEPYSNVAINPNVKILDFLIANNELFFDGFAVENYPNKVIFVMALNNATSYIEGSSLNIKPFFILNYYTCNSFIIEYGLTLSDEKLSAFFLKITDNLKVYNGEITPKTYLKDQILPDESFNNLNHQQNKLIVFFKILYDFGFKFYKRKAILIFSIALCIILFLTNFYFYNFFNLFIFGFINELDALSTLSFCFILLSISYFTYKQLKNINSEIISIPNSIFIFRILIFTFFILHLNFTSKPCLKIGVVLFKLLILFILWLFSKNENNLNLEICENFGESFYDLEELSKKTPFLVLLPLGTNYKNDYPIFSNYTYHFNINKGYVNYGVYSPPLINNITKN